MSNSKTDLNARMLAMRASLAAGSAAAGGTAAKRTTAAAKPIVATRREVLAARVLQTLRAMGFKDKLVVAKLTGADEGDEDIKDLTDIENLEDLANAPGSESITTEEVMQATIRAIRAMEGDEALGLATDLSLNPGANPAPDAPGLIEGEDETTEEQVDEMSELMQAMVGNCVSAKTRHRMMVSLVASMNQLMLAAAPK